jgi:hypothetical protein
MWISNIEWIVRCFLANSGSKAREVQMCLKTPLFMKTTTVIFSWSVFLAFLPSRSS